MSTWRSSRFLTARLGPVAGKLHTARSRNDQVATDLRLYVRDAIDGLTAQIAAVQANADAACGRGASGHAAAGNDPLAARPAGAAWRTTLLAYFWMLDAGQRTA